MRTIKISGYGYHDRRIETRFDWRKFKFRKAVIEYNCGGRETLAEIVLESDGRRIAWADECRIL